MSNSISNSVDITKRNIGTNANSSIPVRSYTDTFAYERFNRLGTKTSTQNIDKNLSDDKIEELTDDRSESSEYRIIRDNQKNENCDIVMNPKSGGAWIDRLFDPDTFLLMVAIIVITLSDNTTNDKLTPLALLAILLF